MCTRRTGPIDDMTNDLPSGNSGDLPRVRYSDLAYNIMINRFDKSRRVVVRRDACYGMKPVKFIFRPTVNKTYGLVSQSQAEALDDVSITNNYIKRVSAPWIPFYRYVKFKKGESTEVFLDQYLTVPHYGLCIALRPESCTNNNIPVFSTKTYLDIEFKGPRLSSTNFVVGLYNQSYQTYPDTLGDGTIMY